MEACEEGQIGDYKIGAGQGHKCTFASARIVRSRAGREALSHLGRGGEKTEAAAEPECDYAVPDRALLRAASGRGRGRGARERRKKWCGANAASPQSGGNERDGERVGRAGGRGQEERPLGYGGARLAGRPAPTTTGVGGAGARAATWVRGGLSAVWGGPGCGDRVTE